MRADDDIYSAFVPRRATDGSAGYDIFSPEDIHLEAGQMYFIDTHIVFDGTEEVSFNGRKADRWVFKIYPRSSMGKKYRMRLLNTTGIIDQDYRDPIKLMIAVEQEAFITKGQAIAQGIFEEYGVLKDEIMPEKKRDGGIGSTDNQKL